MTTTEAEDLKEEFHLRREAAKHAVTPVTETGIMDEMGRYAWSGDSENYNLSDEAIAQLIAFTGIAPVLQADFTKAINQLVTSFCMKHQRYLMRKGHGPMAYDAGVKPPKQTKITTELKKKSGAIVKNTEWLLEELEAMRDEEAEWLFGYAYPGHTAAMLTEFKQWVALTLRFQRLAEESPIETKTANVPILRNLAMRCMDMLERFTDEKFVRSWADDPDQHDQMIHGFMVTLLYHLPEPFHSLADKKGVMSGAIREAIDDRKKQATI